MGSSEGFQEGEGKLTQQCQSGSCKRWSWCLQRWRDFHQAEERRKDRDCLLQRHLLQLAVGVKFVPVHWGVYIQMWRLIAHQLWFVFHQAANGLLHTSDLLAIPVLSILPSHRSHLQDRERIPCTWSRSSTSKKMHLFLGEREPQSTMKVFHLDWIWLECFNTTQTT